MKIDIISADYFDPKQARDIIFLMDEYAKDPMGGHKGLPDDIKTNLVAKLAKISGAFSVIAYKDDYPVGLINCFEGFSTFSCNPLINIHDIIVSTHFLRYKF